jgi:hypothetical protein
MDGWMDGWMDGPSVCWDLGTYSSKRQEPWMDGVYGEKKLKKPGIEGPPGLQLQIYIDINPWF